MSATPRTVGAELQSCSVSSCRGPGMLLVPGDPPNQWSMQSASSGTALESPGLEGGRRFEVRRLMGPAPASHANVTAPDTNPTHGATLRVTVVSAA